MYVFSVFDGMVFYLRNSISNDKIFNLGSIGLFLGFSWCMRRWIWEIESVDF